MADKTLYDAVVVGGGPAGLTAAIYLARACYRTLVIEKEKFGGQITITSEVANYPGALPQSGEALTQTMRKQAESFGAEFMIATVESLDLNNTVKIIKTSKGDIKALGVLLATGSHPRELGFEGEKEFKGHGVAYCATCDGEFFKGKEIFVIGGSYAAAEEGDFLTRYATHVTIMMRGEDFKCAKEVADKARNNPKISIINNTEVVRVEGDDLPDKIVYRNRKTGITMEYVSDKGFGVFVFAGYEPSTQLVKDIAECNEQGYIITDSNGKTNVEGLYAAGDVRIKPLRQVVTAVSDGALAATEMEKYLKEARLKTGENPGEMMPQMKAEPKEEYATETNNSLFNKDMADQLQTVFNRMESNLELRVYSDGRKLSEELIEYMSALSQLTDKLSLSIITDSNENGLPFVSVYKEDGSYSGISFHGVPGGHEFTSFILGLYNAAGPGQSVSEDTKANIKAMNKKTHMTLMVSLSCTMCPDLISAAERIVTLNPDITMDTYDLNHYPDLKDKYNIMSVPCFIINDSKPMFGKKNIEELVTLIEQN